MPTIPMKNSHWLPIMPPPPNMCSQLVDSKKLGKKNLGWMVFLFFKKLLIPNIFKPLKGQLDFMKKLVVLP
jgi:hypothetical protein